MKASKSVDEFEKTDSVNSSQLSEVRSWLHSSGYGKKEQDMSLSIKHILKMKADFEK